MTTIAIIDDDIHISNMLTEVLTKKHYHVIHAYSGTEALYLLSLNKPDLVLLDFKTKQSVDTAFLSVGDLTLNTNTLILTVYGHEVKLTRTEYAILKLLMENPKQVISKGMILDRISMDTPDCTERSLKQHISNLRKKLQDVSGIDYIETVWGIGFKLTEQKS